MSGYNYGQYGDEQYGVVEYIDPALQISETTVVNKSLTPLPPPIFSGMKLQEDVILGSLVFNKIDENNVVWVCTDIEGWWEHPDAEIPDIARGWGDGSYEATGRWAARQITLNGSFLTPDPNYVPDARNTLVIATSLVRQGAWLKTLENPTRASFVRLSGKPSIVTVNPRGRTDFSIGLRAADPIKYSWNDSDPEGYDTETILCKNVALSRPGTATIENVGNTDVSTFIEITGPIVGPATIVNSTTNETLTIVDPLRTSESRSVTFKQIVSYVATLTVGSHNIVVGDYVTVSGVGSEFNGTRLVTDIGLTTISFESTTQTVSYGAASGTVARSADVLEVDTYNHEVAYNGETAGARVMIDTLTDWITLAPGNNSITFIDEGAANSTSTLIVYYRSGWIG